jgi:hypothetical protein
LQGHHPRPGAAVPNVRHPGGSMSEREWRTRHAIAYALLGSVFLTVAILLVWIDRVLFGPWR